MRLTRSQQDALNIEKHVCVTAGAGSGKTTVLVERYLKILRESNVATPREIVAITFTEKAAAEMKERIIEELSVQEEDVGVEPDNRLQSFREKMGSAHISTIHAFCSRILREFPFQADVPANFGILQGIDQKLLLQRTIRETLKKIATDTLDKHRAELTRLLKRYGGQQKLVDFFSTMINQRDILEHLMLEIYDDRDTDDIRDDWEQSAHAELMAIIDRMMSQIDIAGFIKCLNAVLEVAKGKNAEESKKLLAELKELCEHDPGSPKVLDLLKAIAKLITTADNKIATRSFLPKSVDRTEIADEIAFLISTAKKIKDVPTVEKESDEKTDDVETDNSDAADDPETDDDFLISTTRDLLSLYKRILNDYQTTKLSQGTLDFSDLQLKTRDLLRDNEEIRLELIGRHKYYMVDEYQDTNELQYELVMLLTGKLECANLFIVGDPKQSIYGFRGADVRVFDKTKEKIVDKGGCDVALTENFRSLGDLIEFTNFFFHRLMGDGNETEFEVSFQPLTRARSVNANGGVEMLHGKQGDEKANEYTLIAQHIKNMKANGTEIWKRDNDGVEKKCPIEYGDIAILIRSRRHLPDIEHALLEEDVPYLTTGGVGFYQRQEIYDIWNYLNFLNAPTKNHVSLVGILRGPAFGISDTELYEISLQDGTNFWEKVQSYEAGTDNLCRAIAILKRHCQIARRLPVNRLVLTIVNETGMIGTLKTGKQGQQRWANYQKLLELARNFDGDENRQILPDFIEFLDLLITEEPQEGQAPIEENTGAVRIMTIHAAKGLQFPVVILPRLDRAAQFDREPFIDEDLGIGFSPLKPDEGYRKTEPEIINLMKNRASARETAEKKRLFYVGTTRAEDRLILSGTLPAKNMLGWLHEHLGMDEEDSPPSLPFDLKVFSGGSQQREDITSAEETGDETALAEFPDIPQLPLNLNEIPATFSVAELANYALCPLRYQLENVLRIPVNGQEETDADATDMAAAIRSTLARIKQRSDAADLDTLIEKVSENYPEMTGESETTCPRHVNNFLNSELGETVLGASGTSINQQIHAEVEEHIINGRLDRLFKDATGEWQVINYKTAGVQDLDTCRPEMELYSLLLHRRYPNQSNLTINFFFTEHNRYERMHFTASELQEAQGQWKAKILALQQGNYEKNLEHCCSCPYADSDGQCIIAET